MGSEKNGTHPTGFVVFSETVKFIPRFYIGGLYEK